MRTYISFVVRFIQKMGFVSGLSLALILGFASSTANATNKFAMVMNDLPIDAKITISQGGAVFGGSTVVPDEVLVAGTAVSRNIDVTNDNGLRVYASVSAFAVGGSGSFNGYYCLKYSATSLADARSRPCSESVYKGATVSTPSYVNYSEIFVVISQGDSPSCSPVSVTWGRAQACGSSVGVNPNGTVVKLTSNNPGTVGSVTMVCNTTYVQQGDWTCNADLSAPPSLSATDGTISNRIDITWNAISGASSYKLQYRKKGASSWTDLSSPTGTSFQWSGLSDESIFEFQVRAENSVGASNWSAVESGYIRPFLSPQFVSQTGIPSRIGVGQSFTYTQVWKNNGSETWAAPTHGTGPFAPDNSSVWGVGFNAFTGSTATGSNTTSTITAIAPTTPGIYPIQRIFWKSGVPYGAPSEVKNVEVVGVPTCSAVTPGVSSTYNANGTVTVTLTGVSSVESATIRAWGEANGKDDINDYSMVLGSNWTATIPVAAHLTPGETKINFEALVANSLFSAKSCATSSVSYLQLPVPVITLTPTMGSFDSGVAGKGFVADRINGVFATVKVDLGSFSNLKVKVEILDQNLIDQGVAVNPASSGIELPLRLIASKLDAAIPAWTSSAGVVRVSYADPEAASQTKVWSEPITVLIAPSSMQVTAVGTLGLPPSVNAKVANAGVFDLSLNGPFKGGLRSYPAAATVKDFADTSSNGEWTATDLDYANLFKTQLVAVARAVPPAGVTLLQPLEFLSAPFLLPVQAPTSVVATDGTREDDVKVTWIPPAVDSLIRFRLFRDEAEISPTGGLSGIEFLDTPPVRGQVYNYRVKTLISNATSSQEVADTGFVPSCRAPRLVGASLNADMSRINGLVERWLCLPSAVAKGRIDSAQTSVDVSIEGEGPYRSFSFVVPQDLADGSHVLYLDMASTGVDLFAQRTFEIPFVLSRASIVIKSLKILYNGSTALQGMEANSIGRFGIEMDGGSGIGFAEEVK